MKTLLSFSLVLSLALSSCCTIVNGKYDDVNVSSNVTGATVKVDGMEKGKTPCVVEVRRTAGQTMTVEKKGYETHSTQLTASASGWLFGNIFAGGIIGLFVDAATGSWVDVEPDSVNANLTPKR